MTKEAFAKLRMEMDEQAVTRAVMDLSKHNRVICVTSVLGWYGVGPQTDPPGSLRLKIKRLLKGLSDTGLLTERPERHSARSGRMETGYELSPP